MEEAGCQPDVVTYNTIINSLGKDRRMNEALDIFSYMKAKGISPTVTSYNSLIHTAYAIAANGRRLRQF